MYILQTRGHCSTEQLDGAISTTQYLRGAEGGSVFEPSVKRARPG